MSEEAKRIAKIKAAAPSPSPRTQTRVDDLRRELVGEIERIRREHRESEQRKQLRLEVEQ